MRNPYDILDLPKQDNLEKLRWERTVKRIVQAERKNNKTKPQEEKKNIYGYVEKINPLIPKQKLMSEEQKNGYKAEAKYLSPKNNTLFHYFEKVLSPKSSPKAAVQNVDIQIPESKQSPRNAFPNESVLHSTFYNNVKDVIRIKKRMYFEPRLDQPSHEKGRQYMYVGTLPKMAAKKQNIPQQKTSEIDFEKSLEEKMKSFACRYINKKQNQIDPIKKNLLFDNIENNFKDYQKLGFPDIFFKEPMSIKEMQKEKCQPPQSNFKKKKLLQESKSESKLVPENSLIQNPQSSFENLLHTPELSAPFGNYFYSSFSKSKQYINCFTKPIIESDGSLLPVKEKHYFSAEVIRPLIGNHLQQYPQTPTNSNNFYQMNKEAGKIESLKKSNLLGIKPIQPSENPIYYKKSF